MAYSTPRYDFARRGADLATNYALDNSAQQFGRFLGQQRYRRGLEDSQIQFKRQFPKIGSSYNQRGMYDSGLRREGQRVYAQDYQRNVDRAAADQATNESQMAQQQALRDAGYQQALLALFEEMNQQRAVQDPFAAIRGIL